MKTVINLAFRSLVSRRATVMLSLAAIAVSVTLLLGVERIRMETRNSFSNTISGTDLVVGARSGSIPLLLYSVFRIGNATNNISWQSYRELADDPAVAWTIPLSLGDSHRGFRVLGTNTDYFRHFRYARTRDLQFAAGKQFDDIFDAVIGAEVADALGYGIGDEIIIDHGVGRIGFNRHEDKPFRVSGILARTGTPVDRTVHVSLGGIEAIHIDWRSGAPVPGLRIDAARVREMNLQPRAITAFLVGLKSRFATFTMQRKINEYRPEPLLAILPGVALQELWSLMGTAERALSAISVFVVATGLIGMVTMLLSGMNERRREMAILRAVGARPVHIFSLFLLEAGFIAVLGAILGMGLLYILLGFAQPLIESTYGLFIAIGAPTATDMMYLGAVVIAGVLAGVVPAIRAVRLSLADGIIVRS
jgi:putative ABC transport system permease protein